MIYFDSTATTKPKQEYLDLYVRISNEYWFNTLALYSDSVKANLLFDKASEVIKKSFNCPKDTVYFTSGATESNNMAIYGICNKYLDNPKHIITSYLEHASVLNVFKDLEKKGFKVTYLVPDKEGRINPSDLEKALTPDTILVSLMWVNNIVGTIQPIKEVINILKNHRAKLHVDAVQGVGKIKSDFDFSDIDMFTVSGHKLHGVKGTGCLVAKSNIDLSFMKGGHQQGSFRPGTVDLPGATVLAKCISDSIKNQEYEYSKTSELYKHLINGLDGVQGIIINNSPSYYSPFILSVTFIYKKAETVLHILEQSNIYIGVGSSCNSHSKEEEPTLTYMLENSAYTKNTIRISLSSSNTIEEVDLLINKIKEIGNK